MQVLQSESSKAIYIIAVKEYAFKDSGREKMICYPW